jgi:cold shock protein
MQCGTVSWFNEARGYGFIRPEAGAQEVFVQLSAVLGSGLIGLQPGQRVSFEVLRGRHGLEAIELRPLAEPRGAQTAAAGATGPVQRPA